MRTLDVTSHRLAPDGSRGGFTLVEALVSLVVLTIGVLGIAQLFAFSSVSGNTSYMRTMAHIHAIDMAERIWLDLEDPVSQVDAWVQEHEGSLPGWSGVVVADPDNQGDDELFEISVGWTRGAVYSYRLRIPKVSDAGS